MAINLIRRMRSLLGRSLEAKDQLRSDAISLTCVPAPAIDDSESMIGDESAELVRIVVTHRYPENCFVNQGLVPVPPPDEFRTENQVVGVDVRTPVVTGNSTALDRDLPAEGLLVRDPIPPQLLGIPLRPEDVQNARTAGRHMGV